MMRAIDIMIICTMYICCMRTLCMRAICMEKEYFAEKSHIILLLFAHITATSTQTHLISWEVERHNNLAFLSALLALLQYDSTCCVCACARVNKYDRVVDHVMCCLIWKCGNLIVRAPLVRVNNSSQSH